MRRAAFFLIVLLAARPAFASDADDTAAWLRKNVRFVAERGAEDHWQPAVETLAKRTGDCEDYAILAKRMLEPKGYDTILLGIWGDEQAHTVLLFTKGSDFGVIDVDRVVRPEDPTIHAAADAVWGELARGMWGDWTYAGVTNEQGIIQRKFNH